MWRKAARSRRLCDWYDSLNEEQLSSIASISMDMWPAYINATLEKVPGADRKIAFDKFHVAKKLSEAVDKVRRQEHRQLLGEGIEDLKGTKYDWLTGALPTCRSVKSCASRVCATAR